MCNQSEEDGDAYLEWEYNRYCEITDKPLPMDKWLQQFESPMSKEDKIDYIVSWVKKVVGRNGMDEQYFRKTLNKQSEHVIDEKYKFYKEQG